MQTRGIKRCISETDSNNVLLHTEGYVLLKNSFRINNEVINDIET